MESYKQLIVWQKSIELVEEIYILTGKLPREEIYGLTSQMRRAAISIPSNIAEGSKRKDLPEYLHFLRMADGSAAELETQLIILGKLYSKTNMHVAESLLIEIQKMLFALRVRLESKYKKRL